MLFFMFIQTTNLTLGGLLNMLFWWMCGLHGRLVFSPLWVFFWVEKVWNVFVLDIDVETNLMPGVHLGILLFDAYFRNIWWLKLYLNNQFSANANICWCVLCKKHFVCVCALFSNSDEPQSSDLEVNLSFSISRVVLTQSTLVLVKHCPLDPHMAFPPLNSFTVPKIMLVFTQVHF